MINFPFGTNGKLFILGVPILKHMTVCRALDKRDGWISCNFTSFSTVFQSYQENRRLIMKGCVQWSSVIG